MSQTLTYVIGQDRRPHVDNVQDFKVNFDGSNTNWVQARQYERSMRQVFVNIKNEDGTPLDLTGCNVWFEGLLPKNSAGDFRVIDDKGYVALDPTAGRFRFDMPGHAFTVAGSYRQAFFRILKDGNSITTLEFDLDVLADKVIDGLVPRTYISPVEELINEIETKYQDSTDKLTKMTSDFVDQFTQSMNTLKALGVTVQNGLDALEAKIKQDGLFTQAEADAFKQEVAGILANAATSKIRGNKKYSTLSERLDDDEQHQIYAYDSINEMLADDSLNDGMIVQTFNHNANDHICQKFMISNQQPSNKLFIKLSNGNYAVEMIKNRPFAPKIVAQPEMFVVDNDSEKQKAVIDGRIYLGYESFVVDVHIDYDAVNGFHTQEDLKILLDTFSYAKELGYSITALKIHYVGEFNDKTVPAYCSFIVSTVIPALKNLDFDKVCILNERQETVTAWTSQYIPEFIGLVNSIKSYGYKVGISYENDVHIAMAYSNQLGLMQSLDWIGCNLYPTISAYGGLTGTDDVTQAFDEAMDSLYMIKQLGKPIIITETGIRPYPQYFASPSNYGFDNSEQGDYSVFTRYFEGMYRSKVKSVAREVWDWHMYDAEPIKELAQLNREQRGVI